jgi:hypothetical protein
MAGEPKSIPESNWLGGASADLAAAPNREYEFHPQPSLQYYLAPGVGLETT